MDEAVIESHDVSSSDRQGVTSILWENTAKLFDATSIAGSLIAHLGSFCDGHLSVRMSSIFEVAKLWEYAMHGQYSEYRQPNWEYLVRRPAKNVISPPNPPPPKKKTPPKKQQCKNQERLASYKKKLIACGKVQCKRRVDRVAASPREYLVRRPAKNVISPPTPPKKKTSPQETTMQKSRASCKLQKEVDSVWQGTVQEKSGSRSSKSKRISCKTASQERY